MKVTIRKYYRYYIPIIFGIFLFLIIYYYLILGRSNTLQSPSQVLGNFENGEYLITDPVFAKVAQSSPLIVSNGIDEAQDTYYNQEPVLKSVEIKNLDTEIIEIIDPNTIIVFKNSTDSKLFLLGAENIWRAEIEPNGFYSQLFEKTGQFKFTINNKPIGVVRVR